ncbi:monovalent cation:proton antiporter-2 (CPA2) family protein [Chitinophaga sp. GCM10012297]|uniref:Cation:proton antiporter n=1 Tax=Chitinophaga chungangae TaxID=2821488 RepID=A0ABS3YJG0_9BACT|nr:monovalent cation:proton antiporter-2 (CPA2) family protein [Chitinophaga chungangae]MBO9154827.1 cation:proton antiporter [Chitinophaga chungangae]
MTNESFFYQALVYLATMVVFVPLAKKLNLGSVLGYLLGGIIIGPALLGLIGHGGEDLMHFAEFGVVMMLFLIGLELEPSLLWKLRAPILGLGGLQVAVTSAAVTGIAMLAGLPWNEALVIGMILSLSSTAIVLQMLGEKGLMGSAAGQSSFSVLLFQDIAVIPMLAIFPLLAPAGAVISGQEESASLIAGQPAWVRTLIVLGAVTSLVIGGRYVVKPILHIVARTGLRELFTASALLLVVAIAVLMTLVGLSPALGAFLGGVVLANSEYRHELESDIEPFKGLLLGLFFIGVGATIDFQLIVEHPLLVTGLVLGIMVLKFGVLLGLGKIFKLSREQNLLFAFALPQVGEFAFVLFSFAGGAALLEKETVNAMMAVVAITMALTPLLMLLFEKVIQPRFGCAAGQGGREPDQIDEHERNPVIIAGFDHFGTIVGRFLRASGVKATVLDLDSDRVDLLRKMGLKVYYGDASRADLLKSAGAAQARIIVIAMATPEKNREVVAAVKKHYPHLQMLVRATDNNDAFELMNDGVLRIYRETVDTSLRLASDVLELLGRRAYQSQRAARMFRRFDERSLKGLSAYRDDKQYVNVVRERIEELQKMIQADAYTNMMLRDAGWDRDNAEERN